jgi:hypothetical protein
MAFILFARLIGLDIVSILGYLDSLVGSALIVLAGSADSNG